MVYNKVSVYQSIDAARRKLGLRDMSEVWDDFVEWVWEGEMKIGSSITFMRKECEISLTDGCGNIPSDFIYLLGYNHAGQWIEPSQADFQLFGNGLADNGVRANISTANQANTYVDRLYGFFANSPLKISVNDGVVRVPGHQEARIGIAYRGICTDEQGLPMVNDLHTDALSEYLVYMYTYRQYLRQMVPEHQLNNTKMRWYEMCRQARAVDEKPDPVSMRVLAGIWNNMLPLPSLNNF